jgi:small GTP-binding protein
MPFKRQEYRFKVIIVGASRAGKSCLLRALCHESFVNTHDVTVGVDYGTTLIKEGNTQFKFCIWDTSGSHTFMPIVKSYFNQSVAAILVFDLTNPDSFKNSIEWYMHYIQICPDNFTILVGNKQDLIETDKSEDIDCLTYGKIGKTPINNFIKKYNLPYMEVSAKTQKNIDDITLVVINDTKAKLSNGKLSVNKEQGITLHTLDNFDIDYGTPISKSKRKESLACCTIS